MRASDLASPQIIVSASLTKEDLAAYLIRGDWRRAFDGAALAQGLKWAKARHVAGVSVNLLDTGDAEIRGRVRDGEEWHEPVIAVWKEGGTEVMDAGCSCGLGVNCVHGAAILAYLAKGKGERVAVALGEKPHAERMTKGQKLAIDDSTRPADRVINSELEPSFLLQVHRRSDDERSAWLPPVYAQAFAVYEDHQLQLEPGGNLPPFLTDGGKKARDRAAEMMALQLLYALDLQPGSAMPPPSPRKLATPPVSGLLWAPDKRQWPHPDYYWQRFRHEGAPALERRGWEIRFSPDVGLRPLVFRTETWRAEMIEETRGWFNLSAGFEIDGEHFDLQPILAVLVQNRFLEATEGMPEDGRFMVYLPDGRGLALPVGRFRRMLTTLGEILRFKFGQGPIKLTKLDATLLARDAELPVEAPKEIVALASQVASLPNVPTVPLPDGLAATLRSYQIEGYCWMQFLARHDLHGILADDMGLGKTLQTLTHILAEKSSGRNGGRPSLVVAPTSVVENWLRESARFTPGLQVLLLQGAGRKKRFDAIPRYDLVLTSYALLSRDVEALAAHAFHVFVLDEAQHIKNAAAQISRNVRHIEATCRLGLSGTPVENHLGELWSLMHFLMPELLGRQDAFNEDFRFPIEKNGNAAKRRALARRVGPLILRRTKQEVAKELPPKTEITHTIELDEAQKDLYETVRATMDKQVREALALQGTESQMVFLDALLKLRQICCHPRLLERSTKEVAGESSKFAYLIDLLETLRQEGHRVLVFSQFTSMLDIIAAHLIDEDYRYLMLTGESKRRQDLVDRFQSGEADVFLISLKAGGTGLTLTGADVVIHYDPWWNPAVENQATDRAYRIGQDKPVFVHKLICKGTVEERIQKMQGRKKHLAAGLLSGAVQTLALTPESLDELFRPMEEGG